MPKRALPTRQKALSTPAKRPTEKETVLDLVKRYRQKAAIGAKFYAQADELLAQVMRRLKVGRRLRMGDGLYAVIVDRFEDENKVWQPVAMKRYELQIQDQAGKLVRMRDRKAAKKAA